MEAERTSVVVVERLQIASGLGLEQRAEAVGFARDVQVFAHVGCDLDEDAIIWAALMELSGAVQVTRTIANGNSAAGDMAQAPNRLG